MKNLKYRIVIIIVFLFYAFNITAQRNVAWVHGLDGDVTSWEHYETLFEAERTEFTNVSSLRTAYNTDNGITNSANQVITSMNTFYGDDIFDGSGWFHTN